MDTAGEMIGVKFVVIVQKDGLNEEEFVKEISKYGNVWDREDNELDPETPVKMFYLKSSFSKYVRFKLDYNCIEPKKFCCFPMASLSDKMQVNKILEKN